MEWQICAAKGALPGQLSSTIRFAYAPKNLEPEGGLKPIGSCDGYTPAGCGDQGYASSDIYYVRIQPPSQTPRPTSREHAGCGPLTPLCSHPNDSCDVAQMETCIYSMMCKNHHELWSLERDQDWHCDMDCDGFSEMRDLIL